MKFWDSSALVSLVVSEPGWNRLYQLLDERDPVIIWWGTSLECSSALARFERSGGLDREAAAVAANRLRVLESYWRQIDPSSGLRDEARRLLRVHPLSAADALQLASALVAADGSPETLLFVCLNERLCLAARREGFPVAPDGTVSPP